MYVALVFPPILHWFIHVLGLVLYNFCSSSYWFLKKNDIQIKISLTINNSGFSSKIYSEYIDQYLLSQIEQYFVSTHEKQSN